MGKINAVITGIGGFVPSYILDNEEMSRIVDTTDEWIMKRIGVKTRHILKPEEGNGTSFMMTKAVEELLQKTQIDPQTIESSETSDCRTAMDSIWRLLVPDSYMPWRSVQDLLPQEE